MQTILNLDSPLLVFLCIAGGAFFIYHRHQQNRFRSLAQQQLQQSPESPNALQINSQQTQTIKALQDQIVYQNQQLTSQALHQVRKTQTLQEVKQVIKTILQQPDFRSAKKHYRKLDSLVSFSLNLEQDWDTFFYIFDQLHPTFYTRLLERFPTLNKSDLRLCALLKLNLDVAEIARLMAISDKSVHMKCYRLRKKMSFDSSHNLYDFILGFRVAA